jgi:hypothetical protein
LGVCQEDLAAISNVDDCVPSQRHTGLVPDFARRLAKALNITFIDCIQEDQRDAAAKDPAKQPATASKILRLPSRSIIILRLVKSISYLCKYNCIFMLQGVFVMS